MRMRTVALLVAFFVILAILIFLVIAAVAFSSLFGFGLFTPLVFGGVQITFWVLLLIIALPLAFVEIILLFLIVRTGYRGARTRYEEYRRPKAYGDTRENKEEYVVTSSRSAMDIIDERYARGEITREEYIRMKEDVTRAQSPPP